MKLWLITQNDRRGYDTYDSAVVAAETEDAARGIHPEGGELILDDWWQKRTWTTDKDLVFAELIGEAVPGTEKGPILGSFNAG